MKKRIEAEKSKIPNILIICRNPDLKMSLQVTQEQDLEVANICGFKDEENRFQKMLQPLNSPLAIHFLLKEEYKAQGKHGQPARCNPLKSAEVCVMCIK